MTIDNDKGSDDVRIAQLDSGSLRVAALGVEFDGGVRLSDCGNHLMFFNHELSMRIEFPLFF